MSWITAGRSSSHRMPAATGMRMNVAEAAAKYADLFELLTWIGLGSAVVFAGIAPLVQARSIDDVPIMALALWGVVVGMTRLRVAPVLASAGRDPRSSE